MADVFNAEVVTLKVAEGAAYGAALQALWCWRRQCGEKVSINEITDAYVRVNASETAKPIPENVAIYSELQSLQNEISLALRNAFQAHRKILVR